MSKKELKRGGIITWVIAGAVTISSAAQLMNLSYRQARRLVKKVRCGGQEALAHGLRGRASMRSISPDIKDKVVSLYEGSYSDFNINHFCEKLQDKHQIEVSREWVRKLLYSKKVFFLVEGRRKQFMYGGKERNMRESCFRLMAPTIGG